MSDRPALFLIYCIFRGRIICTKFSVSIYVGHLERNANTTINPNYSSSWHLRSSLAPTTEFLYNYCFVSTTFSLFNIYFAESDWFEVIFRDNPLLLYAVSLQWLSTTSSPLQVLSFSISICSVNYLRKFECSLFVAFLCLSCKEYVL